MSQNISLKVARWNVLFIIAAAIGLLYAIYIISYMASTSNASGSAAEQLGTSIAMALIFPHVVVLVVSVILNIVTVFTNSTVLGLLTGIFYSVAALLMPIYILFVAAPIVLSWIGFAQLRKRNLSLQGAGVVTGSATGVGPGDLSESAPGGTPEV